MNTTVLKGRQKTFGVIGLMAVLALEAADNGLRERGGRNPYLAAGKSAQLLLCGLCVLVQAYRLQKRGVRGLDGFVFARETVYVLEIAAAFALLSLFFQIKNSVFYPDTLKGLVRWVLPLLVSAAVLNVFDLDTIKGILKYYLILSFLVYLLIQGRALFNPQSYRTITLAPSYSVFESHYFSPTAIAAFLFFCYFDDRKIYKYISAVFVLYTYKRPMIACVIGMLLFGGPFKRKGQIKKGWAVLLSVGLAALTVFLVALFSGAYGDLFYRVTGMDLGAFTMWRTSRVETVKQMLYVRSGLSSINAFYRNIEMDMVQFYMEMGILSVLILVVNLMRLARRNLFSLAMCIFCLAELITSHW